MKYKITSAEIRNTDFLELSKEEYEKYQHVRKCLLNCLFIEEKFDLLIENYLEYEQELLDLSVRPMVLANPFTPGWERLGHAERRTITRRIANLLSLCKLYIDQTKHHVSTIYGQQSEEYTALDSEQSKQYDNLFGYEAMAALRNHVQHNGYPIHAVRHPYKRNENQIMFTLTPVIITKYLEDNKYFKQSTLRKLKQLDEKIDIRPLMREYLEGLGNVHHKLREILDQDLSDWDDTIRTIFTKYKNNFDIQKSIAWLDLKSHNENDEVIEETTISTKVIDRRKSLRKKNTSLSGLTRRYVSNKT